MTSLLSCLITIKSVILKENIIIIIFIFCERRILIFFLQLLFTVLNDNIFTLGLCCMQGGTNLLIARTNISWSDLLSRDPPFLPAHWHHLYGPQEGTRMAEG
jgi:hypothetical protein